MNTGVRSGYTSIFRPPYTGGVRPSIYCVNSTYGDILVMLPLTPSFANDAIKIIQENTAREIYLVVQDIGVTFISDYYNVWYYVTKKMMRDLKILSAYLPENRVSSGFKESILRSNNRKFNIYFPQSTVNVGTISVEFLDIHQKINAPFACDILISDTINRKLFVTDMNAEKCEYLSNECSGNFDEIHMAFMTSNYGGLDYQTVITNYPTLKPLITCAQYSTFEEYEYGNSIKARAGKRFIC